MKALELDGAVVLITGAARGIGRATVEAFADAGARVVGGDLDGDGEVHALDVTSRDSFAAFVGAALDEHGRIDVLVNNAGIMPAGAFLDEDDATTAAILDVNLWGPIHGMRLVLPAMIERGRGHVVNVASMMGKMQLPGLATYGASKHALVGLTAGVRAELAGTGVSATTILPAVVHTELASGIPIPLSGVIRVEPEDVARAIVESCASRPAERSVPRWVNAYPTVHALVPERVESALRRLVGDDKALTAVDPVGRAAYEERVARQAAGRQGVHGGR